MKTGETVQLKLLINKGESQNYAHLVHISA